MVVVVGKERLETGQKHCSQPIENEIAANVGNIDRLQKLRRRRSNKQFWMMKRSRAGFVRDRPLYITNAVVQRRQWGNGSAQKERKMLVMFDVCDRHHLLS